MKALLIFAMISTSVLTAQEEPKGNGEEHAKEDDQGILGFTLQPNAKGVVVRYAFRGSPAFLAGLKKDDLITRVDGRALEGMKLEDQISILRGEVGSEVNITVSRPNPKRDFIVHLVRASKEKLLQPLLGELTDKSEMPNPRKLFLFDKQKESKKAEMATPRKPSD